jgi:hemerythrin-like domain-containing protein
MTDDGVLIDTSDMIAIHNVFRRALEEAPAQIAAVDGHDTERAGKVADYLAEVLWLLHVHHEGEDELLYPLLEQRVPAHKELFARMQEQHAILSTSLETAVRSTQQFGLSGSVVDGQSAADALTSLLAAASGHLKEEEEEVLPIAARVMSPPEWGAMPAHALSQYRGQRVWLPFGLALEGMPDTMRENLLAQLPPPVLAMWTGGGSDAFEEEMASIRRRA